MTFIVLLSTGLIILIAVTVGVLALADIAHAWRNGDGPESKEDEG